MEGRASFNSRCPYHKQHCKCSHRKTPLRQASGRAGVEQKLTWSSARIKEAANHGSKDAGELAWLTPYTIVSPEAHREQLRARFLGHYFPSEELDNAFLQRIYATWFQPLGKAMATAIDCSLVFHYSSIANASALDHHAKRLHGAAVRSLRKELNRANATMNDGILGAIDMLDVCSQFRQANPADGMSTVHRKGLMAVISARGCRTLQSKFARNVVLNLIPVALMEHLYTRKTLLFGRPDWCDALRPSCRTEMQRLVLEHLPLPELLEGADQLLKASEPAQSSVIILLAKLSSAKASMAQWYHSIYQMESSPRRYCLVSVATIFPEFLHQHQSAEDPYPFDEALHFVDPYSASLYHWYTVGNLLVSDAILSIANKTVRDEVKKMFPEIEDIRISCDYNAQLICQCVPYLHSCGFSDVVCNGMLYAKLWYDRINHTAMTKWCTQMIKQFEESEKFSPSTGGVCIDRVFSGHMMIPRE